ncbi:MarR family winged helix-turn-helix transcriptional regulator [Arthrobacter sp. ISL-95]|uniref:MarR family winged helix-turn-helix transcriptional regulator n=1 Tax=Arthrobacter sp. ISL-95 TaxID=2819116 RepID=UPI001BE90FD5|nr:MarR family transcriptional regulator [Arthrobacter sp. ISL-95]MBT2587819.1 MarR family transcriptional regulator [Arthrobacter sp. ISL-95]
MTHGSMTDQLMTRSFFDALRPLLRRLNAERTLSPGKLGVLSHLAEQGRATSSELAAVVQVSPQAISLAVGELERLGFVARVPDEEDRRRTWITLTDAGQQKLAQELASGYAWLDRAIAERLTPEGRKALEAAIPVLRKLGSEASVD